MSNDVTSMLRVNNFEMISPRIALLLTFSFVNSFHSSCLGEPSKKKANCARIEKLTGNHHMRSHPLALRTFGKMVQSLLLQKRLCVVPSGGYKGGVRSTEIQSF